MTADIEEYDLPFGDEEHEDRAIGVGKTDGMTAGEFAGQRMEPETGPKGVVLQIGEHFAKASFQIGMFPEKLPRLPQKPFGGRRVNMNPTRRRPTPPATHRRWRNGERALP